MLFGLALERRWGIHSRYQLAELLGYHGGNLFPASGAPTLYAAFALDTNVSLRADVLTQFQLDPEDVTLDFQVSPAAVARKRWGNHYEQPTDP